MPHGVARSTHSAWRFRPGASIRSTAFATSTETSLPKRTSAPLRSAAHGARRSVASSVRSARRRARLGTEIRSWRQHDDRVVLGTRSALARRGPGSTRASARTRIHGPRGRPASDGHAPALPRPTLSPTSRCTGSTGRSVRDADRPGSRRRRAPLGRWRKGRLRSVPRALPALAEKLGPPETDVRGAGPFDVSVDAQVRGRVFLAGDAALRRCDPGRRGGARLTLGAGVDRDAPEPRCGTATWRRSRGGIARRVCSSPSRIDRCYAGRWSARSSGTRRCSHRCWRSTVIRRLVRWSSASLRDRTEESFRCRHVRERLAVRECDRRGRARRHLVEECPSDRALVLREDGRPHAIEREPRPRPREPERELERRRADEGRKIPEDFVDVEHALCAVADREHRRARARAGHVGDPRPRWEPRGKLLERSERTQSLAFWAREGSCGSVRNGFAAGAVRPGRDRDPSSVPRSPSPAERLYGRVAGVVRPQGGLITESDPSANVNAKLLAGMPVGVVVARATPRASGSRSGTCTLRRRARNVSRCGYFRTDGDRAA